jgi:tRNA threonylcarbamoyladenosine biosynthesis protein TsaE
MLFSLDEIENVAKKIIDTNPMKIILFNGEMGVGKTTLIKELSAVLGVIETTSSPTFSVINEYHTKNEDPVYHFDFYRLKNEVEALDMGIDDYLYSGNWCFIEWGEKIQNLIPHEYSEITITLISDGKRRLTLK